MHHIKESPVMTAQLHACKGTSNLVTVPALPWTQLIWEQRTRSLGKDGARTCGRNSAKTVSDAFPAPNTFAESRYLNERAAKEAEIM